jgi:hypothetical protein
LRRVDAVEMPLLCPREDAPHPVRANAALIYPRIPPAFWACSWHTKGFAASDIGEARCNMHDSRPLACPVAGCWRSGTPCRLRAAPLGKLIRPLHVRFACQRVILGGE